MSEQVWDKATDIQRLQMISGMNLMPFLRINSCIEAINYFRGNLDKLDRNAIGVTQISLQDTITIQLFNILQFGKDTISLQNGQRLFKLPAISNIVKYDNKKVELDFNMESIKLLNNMCEQQYALNTVCYKNEHAKELRKEMNVPYEIKELQSRLKGIHRFRDFCRVVSCNDIQIFVKAVVCYCRYCCTEINKLIGYRQEVAAHTGLKGLIETCNGSDYYVSGDYGRLVGVVIYSRKILIESLEECAVLMYWICHANATTDIDNQICDHIILLDKKFSIIEYSDRRNDEDYRLALMMTGCCPNVNRQLDNISKKYDIQWYVNDRKINGLVILDSQKELS